MSAPPTGRTDSTTLDAVDQPAPPKHPPTSHRSDHPAAGHSSDRPAPPDWSMVPFPVGCPRCGHGLNGSTDAACSACGLALHWPDVVPIEKLKCQACRYPLYGLTTERCPECGEPFTWESALERFHRTNKNLFEYRWRVAPLRSLWSSFRLSLSPRKTWETIKVTDPPPTKPLLWLLMGGITLGAAFPWIMWQLVDATLTFLEDMKSTSPFLQLRWYFDNAISKTDLVLTAAIGLPTWSAAGVGSLLLLRWSMAKCRVKNGHVLRAFVYSALPMLMLPPVANGAFVVAGITDVLFGTNWFFSVPAALSFVTLAWFILAVVRIRTAYRGYIQMNHALGVALLTQCIAALSVAIILIAKVLLF